MPYIDKDETIKAVREQYFACDTDTDYLRGIQQGFDFAMSIIRRQPTADVVEVVRCKDCKHRTTHEGSDFWHCDFHGLIFKPDDYCSYAERRESE